MSELPIIQKPPPSSGFQRAYFIQLKTAINQLHRRSSITVKKPGLLKKLDFLVGGVRTEVLTTKYFGGRSDKTVFPGYAWE